MKKLVIVACLLIGASLGCKQLGSLAPGGGAGGGGGTASGGSDPKADVIAASKKFIDLKSFTANMHGVGQSEIKSQVKYAAPDRFHITYLGGVGAGMEMIMLGKESFMKSPLNGKWSKMPGGNNAAIPNLRDSFSEEGLKTLTDVKYEGEESVDGKQALVYSYRNKTPVGDYPFTSKIWVGKDSGLPIKIFVEYTNGALKHMTVNYDTDTPVTIEAPAA